MDIIHHSLPINLETNGSTHRASIQNFQKSPKMKNEIIMVAINKNLSQFALIYLKKYLLVILIVIELLLQTSYRNNVNTILWTAIGMFAGCR